MNRIILAMLLCLSLMTSGSSQGQGLRVEYTFDMANNGEAPAAPSGLTSVVSIATSHRFELICNSSESIFQSLVIGNDDLQSKIADRISGGSTKYYTSIKDDIYLEEQTKGIDIFHIRSSQPNIEWRITNEKRTVQGILCLKAIGLYTIETHEGRKILEYEAWFAPSLAFPFGPRGIGGLPGVILFWSNGKISYSAASIAYCNTDVSLKTHLNDQAKVLTLEQFQLLLRK